MKMWMLLRLLEDQEEHFYCVDERTLEKFSKGMRACVGEPAFAAYCSNHALVRGILPFWALRYFRPDSVKKYTQEKANIQKMRAMLSLISSAKSDGYIDAPKKTSEEPNAPDKIRISHAGDEFITYAGGLEALIRRYPSLWGLIAISLVPWIATNHRKFIAFVKGFF